MCKFLQQKSILWVYMFYIVTSYSSYYKLQSLATRVDNLGYGSVSANCGTTETRSRRFPAQAKREHK